MNPILVIEDEQAMRLLIQDYLEYLGYTVLLAADGKTALDLVGSEAISIAFVDINLPDMSGVEVMQEMRTQGVSCPLVIISGNLRESYADEVAHLDVCEILEKPIDLTDLEQAILTHVATFPDSKAAQDRVG